MRGAQQLFTRLGRAQVIAGTTALAVVVAAVTGLAVKDGDPASRLTPAEGTAAPYGLGPLATLAPAYSGAPGTGLGGTVPGGPIGSSGPGGTTGPGGVFVRGPATGSPIKVGVHFNDNEGAAAQFGVGGLPDISDAEVNAVIAQVNKLGGLAGHKIQPVYHRTDPLNGTFDAQGQVACEKFTIDDKVSFVIDVALSPSKVVMDCLAKRKIPLLWELHMAMVTAAEVASRAGYLYRPSMPNADRYGFVIDALQRDGFFKGAKVGIVRYESPESALISDKVFKPRLKQHGVPVVAEAPMTKPDNAGGAAGLAGQSSNAVLDFKDKGVTHVLFVPSGGAIPLTFLPAAASQGYEPRYGITSADAPDFIGLNFPESQIDDARVVGWVPNLDGDDPARNDAFARCKAAAAAASLTWDENIQVYCDAFYLMHAALYDASAVSAVTFRSGIDKLGSTFGSPYTFGTRYGPGRYDAPTTARMLKYDAAKPGWRYYGSTFGI